MGSSALCTPIDLGDGLVLRFATKEDAERLAAFHHAIFDAEHCSEDAEFDIVGGWVRHLVSGQHPTFQPADFIYVEEVASGRIVSSMCLISQTWAYGRIPFGFGQPEIVATHPDYRRRGLVRRQFDVIHRMSAERGELMLGIVGIPHFYAQFGYEMAMNLGGEHRIRREAMPTPPDPPMCRLRPIAQEDRSFIRELYEGSPSRRPFSAVLSDAEWDHAFRASRDAGPNTLDWRIIEGFDGRRIGYVATRAWLDEEPWHTVAHLELVRGVNYLNVMPSLLAELLRDGEKAATDPTQPADRIDGVRFALGVEHPAYIALPPRCVEVRPPYASYIRIPDLVGFLRHIRPALERNLIGTPAEGWTGTLELNFYRSGIRIVIDEGTIREIEPATFDDGNARFPNRTFLHLLCGRKRCAELADMFADCSMGHEEEIVLDSLFPPFNGTI